MRSDFVKIYDVEIASSPKISKSDTFPLRMLIRIHDYVFGSINLSQRFTDIKARDPVGASDLNANLRSRAPDQFLKEIALFARNSGVKGASFSVFGRNAAARHD
jgi:hypothetical protein